MGLTLRAWLLAAALLTGCTQEVNDWKPIVFDDYGETKSKKRPEREPTREAIPAATEARRTPSPNSGEARAIERSDVGHLRARARRVHRLLVQALPKSERALVEDIPFIVDAQKGEVNAFAACLSDGRALVALSDGLAQVQAQLARAQATDEVFGTAKLDAYLRQLAGSRRLLPPSGFISTKMDRDPRKRARQTQLLDEGLAFVIGHELAHHRLHHTGCVGSDRGRVTSADVGRLLTSRLPMFNQPNELASDVYGIQNVLRAEGTGWTEDGALLMLRFFRARTRMSLRDALVFGFERSHPHPDVRIPAVEQTARAWRLSGGRSLPKLPNLVL